MLTEIGCRLRIYITESDKKDGKPLYEWIIKEARHSGLCGAAVIRGILGFGSHGKIHTTKLVDLNYDLPVIVEVVDSVEKIEAFLPVLEGAIKEGLVTLDEVKMRVYRNSE